MHHPGSLKPASIANEQNEIQIVDTHESSGTRISIGIAACRLKINRTLLIVYKKAKFDNLPTSFLAELKQGVEDAL